MVHRSCRACGKPFQVPYPSSKRTNCSYKCRGVKTKTRADKGTRKAKWLTIECAFCGKSFERRPGEVKDRERKGWVNYCSWQCRDANAATNTGRPVSNRGKGARYLSYDGYVVVYVPPKDRSFSDGKGRIHEHRLVMAKKLGRPLKRWETIHHINGNKTDNRLKNLQLRSGRHGTGGVLRCRACGSSDIEHVSL